MFGIEFSSFRLGFALGLGLLLTASLWTGCAEVDYQYYHGDVKPHNELAVLHASTQDPISIRSVDGKPFSYLLVLGRVNADAPFAIELLPGHHDIQVFYGKPTGIQPHLPPRPDVSLVFGAKAGHDYRLMYGLIETNIAGKIEKVSRPNIVDDGLPKQE